MGLNGLTFLIGFYALYAHNQKYYDIFFKLCTLTMLLSQALSLITLFHLLEVAAKVVLIVYVSYVESLLRHAV